MPRLALLLAVLLLAAPDERERERLFDDAFATITEEELRADLDILAGPDTEGRDSPSAGLARAAAHVAARLAAAGYTGAGPDGSFLRSFTRPLPAPDPAGCELRVLDRPRPNAPSFTLEVDYVPVWRTEGRARGELVLLGFGIDDPGERFDEVTGELEGRIALIVSGEPRHKRKFEGDEVSAAADLYTKLETLREAGLSGALVVRRPPPADEDDGPRRTRGATAAPDPDPAEPPPPRALGFRHTWASWVGHAPPADPAPGRIPALELTPEAAARLTGLDVLARLAEVDRRGRPLDPLFTGVQVELAASVVEREVAIPNVVGLLRGSDPALADEVVVLGAHYDHVGVDRRGRVGHGADDNASGTAALLEIAEALAAARPRRSVLACAFAAEEDGLLGSDALLRDPPVPVERMVAMLNLDMVGHGEPDEVAVIGVPENPSFEALLRRAEKLARTRLRDITTGQGRELFQRSDHYSFHRRGVPTLFFFEGLPISRNPHYHTWRDTLEIVSVDKVARTARLVFNTAWLLTEDETRPPPPESAR